MKKQLTLHHITVSAILFLTLFFFFSFSLTGSALSSEPVRIAVLPFEINAAQNLDFLKEGIQDMLNSRLTWKDEVKVIDKESVKRVSQTVKEKGFSGESHALLAGGELKADFVIHGSITVIGNSTSIDSKLIDISGKHQPVSFFRQTSDLGGVIPAVNQFATNINETIFRRNTTSTVSGLSTKDTTHFAAAASPQQTAGSAVSSSPMPAQSQQKLQQQHQKHQKQGNLNSNFIISSGQAGNQQLTSLPNPDFSSVGRANTAHSRTTTWKSRPFKHLINGIDIGDVNNDNILETVIISDHSVFIYQFSGNRFVKIAEAAKNRLSTFIGVDIGDINQNGMPEIFITSLTPEKNALNSFVLEYNGRSYSKIVKKTPWYFRTVNSRVHGKMLLGQYQKKNSKDIYSSRIYSMAWNGTQYKPQKMILESGKANALGSLVYDINGDNMPASAILTYNKAEHLTLFNGSGKVIWKDLNTSGGTVNKFILPREAPTDTSPVQFFPLRIRATDINNDGTIEIFYATNHDATFGFLSKIKSLGKGIITCSSWSGTAFTPNWTTPQQPGRISDFVIGDFDNDGLKELVISTVSKEGFSAFSEQDSLITAYEIME